MRTTRRLTKVELRYALADAGKLWGNPAADFSEERPVGPLIRFRLLPPCTSTSPRWPASATSRRAPRGIFVVGWEF